MKHLLIALICSFSGLWALAQEPVEMTLEDAIKYSLENNLSLKNSQVNIADASQQIIERRAIGIPQLSAGANYQYFVQLPKSLVPARFFDPSAPDDAFAELQFGTRNNLTISAELSALLFDASYITGLRGRTRLQTICTIRVQPTKI